MNIALRDPEYLCLADAALCIFLFSTPSADARTVAQAAVLNTSEHWALIMNTIPWY
jgi:hypothetical protein